MEKPRYLTKSRFKLATECPTKLFYTAKKEYLNKKMDDAFLLALANGGFQVGELAKHYHAGGEDVASLDYEIAEQKTLELLKKDNVIIYEPAIRYKNLFVRIDILIKRGKSFELIEVKSKSYDKNEDSFYTEKGKILAKWMPYLLDVAFQKHVLSKAYPDSNITSYLMLADKTAVAGTDGLNQKFKISRDSGRKSVKVSSTLTKEDLENKLLTKVSADDAIDLITSTYQEISSQGFSWEQEINYFADMYEKDQRITSQIGSHCNDCEFNPLKSDMEKGSKNGFQQCWSEALRWKEKDFDEPNVLSIWNFRSKDKLIAQKKIKFKEIKETDFNHKPTEKFGLSTTDRQWLQVKMVNEGIIESYFDKESLKAEMSKWTYPLHFIDFETSMVAIPFNKGRRPYEGIAFQFSHHTVDKDGKVEHAGEYLNVTPGQFPNYDFIRALKKELENDKGTIFRYTSHENTYLNQIYKQLSKENDKTVPDKKELCEFIKSITVSTKNSTERWAGGRAMVDLWELVKRFYYSPMTNGSTSIKYVLPAILNSSKHLQEKYSKPIYGAQGGIKSLNFKDFQWIEIKDKQVVDPYQKLPKLFSDVTEKNLRELMTEDDELADGGAALTAYGKLQFAEMSEYERVELSSALLKYCELDTLAMVMIYEGWKAQ